MHKWEYMVVEQTGHNPHWLAEQLTVLGLSGWEAFAVEPASSLHCRCVWLKRQVDILPLPKAKKPFSQMEVAEH